MTQAFASGLSTGATIANPHTIASGLRVPQAIGDFIMLDILRQSRGTALAVPDEELLAGAERLGATEGIFAAPESGACVAALQQLVNESKVDRSERVVLFNTGSGLKYLEAFRKPPSSVGVSH